MLFPLLVIFFVLDSNRLMMSHTLVEFENRNWSGRTANRTKRNSNISRAGLIDSLTAAAEVLKQLQGENLLICWNNCLALRKPTVECAEKYCVKLVNEYKKGALRSCGAWFNQTFTPNEDQFTSLQGLDVFLCSVIERVDRREWVACGATQRKAMKGISVIEKAEAEVSTGGA